MDKPNAKLDISFISKNYNKIATKINAVHNWQTASLLVAECQVLKILVSPVRFLVIPLLKNF